MKFEDYFKKVGIKEIADYEKLNILTAIASAICPEEIERAFLTDDNQMGRITDPRLWFFSKGYGLWIGGWTSMDSSNNYRCAIQVMPLNIQWLDIHSSDYDFKKATDKSILEVSVKFKGYPSRDTAYITKITAIAGNCDELKEIITHYLKPKTV